MLFGKSFPNIFDIGLELRIVTSIDKLNFVVRYDLHVLAKLVKLKLNIVNFDGVVDISFEDICEKLSDLFGLSFDGSSILGVLDDLLVL